MSAITAIVRAAEAAVSGLRASRRTCDAPAVERRGRRSRVVAVASWPPIVDLAAGRAGRRRRRRRAASRRAPARCSIDPRRHRVQALDPRARTPARRRGDRQRARACRRLASAQAGARAAPSRRGGRSSNVPSPSTCDLDPLGRRSSLASCVQPRPGSAPALPGPGSPSQLHVLRDHARGLRRASSRSSRNRPGRAVCASRQPRVDLAAARRRRAAGTARPRPRSSARSTITTKKSRSGRGTMAGVGASGGRQPSAPGQSSRDGYMRPLDGRYPIPAVRSGL